MPKQIYGHKAPVARRQSSSSKEELSGYLTLAPALTAAAERTRLAAAELAVADVLLEVDDAMRAAAAPSLIEYAVASKPAALPAWRAVVGECLDDLLGDHAPDDALALVHAVTTAEAQTAPSSSGSAAAPHAHLRPRRTPLYDVLARYPRTV